MFSERSPIVQLKQLVARIAEHLAGALIDLDKVPGFEVMHEYEVIDGVEDGTEALLALPQCQLRLLEIGDVHHRPDQAGHFPRFGTERKEIRQPITLDARSRGSYTVNLRVQDGLAALVDRPVELHDPVRESGDDLAQSAADMRADGESVDLRHVLIDPHDSDSWYP